LASTKADRKAVKKVFRCKQSRQLARFKEKVLLIKENIFREIEIRENNPLPMQSTRALKAEHAKLLPKFIHPSAVPFTTVEEDDAFRKNPKQFEWPHMQRRIETLHRLGLDKETIKRKIKFEFTSKTPNGLPKVLKSQVVEEELKKFDEKLLFQKSQFSHLQSSHQILSLQNNLNTE